MPGARNDFALSGNKAIAISGIQAFVQGLMGLDIKLPVLKTLQVISATQLTQAALWRVIACTAKC